MSAAMNLDLESWAELSLLARPDDAADPVFARMRTAYVWAMRRIGWLGQKKRGQGDDAWKSGGRYYTAKMLADDAADVSRRVHGPGKGLGEDFRAALADTIAAALDKRHARSKATFVGLDYTRDRFRYRTDYAVMALLEAVVGQCSYSAVIAPRYTHYRDRPDVSTSSGRGRGGGGARVHATAACGWYSRCYLADLTTIEVKGERKLVLDAKHSPDGTAAIVYLAASSSSWRQASARLVEATAKRDANDTWRIVRAPKKPKPTEKGES